MWEYRTIENKDQNVFMREANTIGMEAWELISIERIHGHVLGYFKRPVSTGKK